MTSYFHFNINVLGIHSQVFDLQAAFLFFLYCPVYLPEKWQQKNSIRDIRNPQPREIVFNTMRYRSNETVHRLGYFQSSVSVQIMFK